MQKIFSTKERALAFVCGELILLFLIIIQTYLLLGIKITNKTFTYFNSPINIYQILLFILSILFLLALYFLIALKDKNVMFFHENFSKVVLGTGKDKITGLDREVLSLLFLETIFAIIVAVSIYIYIDPEVNVVPWPYNYLTFIAIFLFGFYIFSNTRPFREAVYGPGIVQKRILPAKRLFPTKRITTKSGLIKISKRKIHSKRKTRKRK
jgi:hypothetical protein